MAVSEIYITRLDYLRELPFVEYSPPLGVARDVCNDRIHIARILGADSTLAHISGGDSFAFANIAHILGADSTLHACAESFAQCECN